MGHLLDRVKAFSSFGNINSAGHFSGSEEGPTGRVGNGKVVDDQKIIVKSWFHGFGADSPKTVRTFYHVVLFAQINLDFLRMGRLYFKHNTVVGHNAWALVRMDVGRCRKGRSEERRVGKDCRW